MKPLRKPFIDQEDWGHPKPYPDYAYGSYTPETYVLHWAGVQRSPVTTTAEAKARTRAIRHFHVTARNWSDAAYNEAAWQPPIRMRGMRANGANKDSGYWGPRTYTVVFYTGTDNPIPHRRMLKGFACRWLEAPGPVTGHGLLPPSPSGVEQNTSCPGPWLKRWIAEEGWFDVLGTMRVGKVNARVRSLKRRLSDLGYWTGRYGRVFTRRLERAVKRFQEDRGLYADGIVDAATWRELSL